VLKEMIIDDILINLLKIKW